MRAKHSAVFAVLLWRMTIQAQAPPATEQFRWGAASAAYQVEGATTADNKGLSIWDVYLDQEHLAGPGISGKVAIDFYNRDQYLKDINLMRKMGLTSYRFSIAWSRIMPDGLGPVNPAGVAHYRRFIEDLQAAGIKPMLTLYHWDMPASLAAAGGWENRASVEWFKRYAEVIFANFADQVDLFVLVNEPLIERDFKSLAEDRIAGRPENTSLLPDNSRLAVSLTTFNHILLASAAAKESFSAKGYKGRIGIALPLFPAMTADGASTEDKEAAKLADGVMNRWSLDAIYKGSYPQDVLNYTASHGMQLDIQPGDAARIRAAHFDYLGINYYAPLFFRKPLIPNGAFADSYNPEGMELAFTGAVRPDQFKNLLDRIRTEYKNPTIFITENGADFPGDDSLVDGKVRDVRRCRYVVTHVAAMRQAIADGSDVRGYHVWSSHDNLEWFHGYGGRYGLIYVDFDTQQRIPKLSAEIYSHIIRGETVTEDACK